MLGLFHAFSIVRADGLSKLLLPVSTLDLLRLNVGLVEGFAVALLKVDLSNLLQNEVITVSSEAHDVENEAIARSCFSFLGILLCNFIIH